MLEAPEPAQMSLAGRAMLDSHCTKLLATGDTRPRFALTLADAPAAVRVPVQFGPGCVVADAAELRWQKAGQASSCTVDHTAPPPAQACPSAFLPRLLIHSLRRTFNKGLPRWTYREWRKRSMSVGLHDSAATFPVGVEASTRGGSSGACQKCGVVKTRDPHLAISELPPASINASIMEPPAPFAILRGARLPRQPFCDSPTTTEHIRSKKASPAGRSNRSA
jgi:hypothetical protein